MSSIAKLDTAIYYLILLYALVSSISIAAANIAISLAAAVAIIRYCKEPIVINIDKGLLRAVGMFLGAVLLSAVFAYNPMIAVNTFGNDLYRMLPLFLTVIFIKNKEQLIKLLIVMGISILIADSYAIWQGIHGNYRANAFGAHPMILAGYLIQMIPLLLIIGLENRYIAAKQRMYFLMLTAICCVALVYNGTRGAWIAVFVTFFIYSVMMIKQNKYILSTFLVVCLFCGMLAMNTPLFNSRLHSIVDMTEQSNSERVLLWRSSWQMFLDHPISGIGAGNFVHVYNPLYMSPEAKEPNLGHAHNNFFHTLAETGIIGISTFVYMFGYILVTMYRRYMINRNDIWSLAAFLVTISLLVQGMTEYNFGSSAVIRMYWLIIGTVYATSRIGERSSQ